MLEIIHNLNELDFRQLMSVYEETNRINGAKDYRNLPENLQILYAEQDFYAYLEFFFAAKDSCYAVWTLEGSYKAALRVEQYLDGMIITGLETAPDGRKNGYAASLMQSTVQYLRENGYDKLYSHIEKSNFPSLRLHEKIGFVKISDTATYIDGSFHSDAYTLCLNL